MTPHEFVIRFKALCQQYGHDPKAVWHHCEMDEHQSLIDDKDGEWLDFEQCLKAWSQRDMPWQNVHDIPLPDIHCKTCKHYLDDFCGLYQREIPLNFNQANACQRWNE